MDFSSSPTFPPSTPQPSHRPSPHNDVPSPPALTSELSELRDPTPSLSGWEEDEDSAGRIVDATDQPSSIATDTIQFWRQKRSGYTFERFLEAWILEKTANDRKGGTRLHKLSQVLQKASVQQRLSAVGIRVFVGDQAQPNTFEVSSLRKEFPLLVTQPAFGKFDPFKFTAEGQGPCSVEDVCNTDWITSAIRDNWPEVIRH
ncbi:hypothetical protein M426DRAFT_325279 [Hypoxylon sp. CI-4A]|nr:hypothetical protein M426DRAFT_325279 [Hypoxylon sp. CI-4A]